jgi:hypothetical protein
MTIVAADDRLQEFAGVNGGRRVVCASEQASSAQPRDRFVSIHALDAYEGREGLDHCGQYEGRQVLGLGDVSNDSLTEGPRTAIEFAHANA